MIGLCCWQCNGEKQCSLDPWVALQVPAKATGAASYLMTFCLLVCKTAGAILFLTFSACCKPSELFNALRATSLAYSVSRL